MKRILKKGLRKPVDLLMIFAFGIISSAALSNDVCNDPNIDNDYCTSKFEHLAAINNQFNKMIMAGGIVNISQPPLIIVPEIQINVPTAKKAQKDDILKQKVNGQSKTKQTLGLDKNYFAKIITALDAKGKRQLNQCMLKLTDKKLGDYYPDFSNELSKLKTVALTTTKQPSKLGSIISRSPSQKECLEYLDFILMIS